MMLIAEVDVEELEQRVEVQAGELDSAEQEIDKLEQRLVSVEQRARVAEEQSVEVQPQLQQRINFREQKRTSARSKMDLYRQSLEKKDEPE